MVHAQGLRCAPGTSPKSHKHIMQNSRPPSVVCPSSAARKATNTPPPPLRKQGKESLPLLIHVPPFGSFPTPALRFSIPLHSTTTAPFRFRSLHPPRHLAARRRTIFTSRPSLSFHSQHRLLSYRPDTLPGFAGYVIFNTLYD